MGFGVQGLRFATVSGLGFKVVGLGQGIQSCPNTGQNMTGGGKVENAEEGFATAHVPVFSYPYKIPAPSQFDPF